MATTTTITKILFRRGNDADRQNTILASGEPGWTLDTSRLYIGDGRTPGGLPALSATEHHLHYVDENDQTGTALRQRLDINMAGLSATMAGDRVGFNSMFHPTDRTITNNYSLQFTGVNTPSEDPDIVYTGETSKSFKIDRALGNEGIINIADTLIIDTATNTITFGTDDTTFNVVANELVFAEGDMTMFEDKTIDLNVPVVNTVPQAPGTPAANAATADKTGFYISHVGYTSAGRIAVAEGADQEAWSTMWLAPPVYDQDWGDTFNRLDRPTTTTNGWQGWQSMPLNTVGSSLQHGSKPLAIRSVRPGNQDGAGYDGYSDLVFETGLIVYGAGDAAAKQDGWNGYLINQSVDTGASVKFQAIELEGDPMDVSSGGTGRDSLTAGGVLLANESDPTGPIQSLTLTQGQLITGDSNNKARATTLSTDNWLDTSIATNGTITIRNRFAPAAPWQNQGQTEADYFNKWYQAQTESGSITPSNNKSSLIIEGDDSTPGSGRRTTPSVSNDIYTRVSGSGAAVEVTHTWQADTLCDAVAAANNDNSDPGAVEIEAGYNSSVATDAQVIGMIKVNRSGHVLDVESRDLSTYINDAIANSTGTFFLTNADSSTVGSNVETQWLNYGKIRFSHDSTPRTSLFDTAPEFNIFPGGTSGGKDLKIALGNNQRILTTVNTNSVFEVANGVARFNGDVVAYHSFSDERLKDNIKPIDGTTALSLINTLQGVRYTWKDHGAADKTGEQIGLIAQQVEQSVPEVVKQNKRIDDDTIYKQVEYDKLVPLLIESVKTLTARVEQLEAELNR